MKNILTFIILTFILISCQSPTDLELDLNSVKEYSELHIYLITSKINYGFIKTPSELDDENAQNTFTKLQSKNKLINISYSNKELIFYKIKQERVEPFLGLGLQYYSHYIIYIIDEEPNFEKIFKENFELEEKLYQSENITTNWYYAIGEHFSD